MFFIKSYIPPAANNDGDDWKSHLEGNPAGWHEGFQTRSTTPPHKIKSRRDFSFVRLPLRKYISKSIYTAVENLYL